MKNVFLNSMGIICSLGSGKEKVREALFSAADPGGLTMTDRYSPGQKLYCGVVATELPDISDKHPSFHTRNNALCLKALSEIRPEVDAAISKFGRTRVAVVLGTSTPGLTEGLIARRHYEQFGTWPVGFSMVKQELGSLADFVAAELGTAGIAHVISTACSSGAKSLASGTRILNAGLADAVIVGGCDVLGEFTVAGFCALEAISAERCNPLSVHRSGINLGEGAAIFLMTLEEGPVRLAGWGETSDAHHISAPDPTGKGAMAAMRLALDRAGLTPNSIDYLNLHGTGTRQNDEMECLAVSNVFGERLAVSSTKPLTGHALAGAGAIEAAFCWLTLTQNSQGLLPPHWWDGHFDPELKSLNVTNPGHRLGRSPRYVVSNSFAFGGSNATLLLGGN